MGEADLRAENARLLRELVEAETDNEFCQNDSLSLCSNAKGKVRIDAGTARQTTESISSHAC